MEEKMPRRLYVNHGDDEANGGNCTGRDEAPMDNTSRTPQVSFKESEKVTASVICETDVDLVSVEHLRHHRRTRSTSEVFDFESHLRERDTIIIPRARSQSLLIGTPISRSHYSSLPNSPAVSFLAQFVQEEHKFASNRFSRTDLSEGSIVAEYQIGKVIGHGSFSECRLGIDLRTGEQIALKMIEPMDDESDDVMNECEREMELWYSLQHPHILKLLDCLFLEQACIFVSPLCAVGNMAEFLKNNGNIDEDTAKNIFSQLVQATEYMHSKQLVHGDIKLENILLDSHLDAFLCDFGLTERIGDDSSTLSYEIEHRGTPAYIPPEFIIGNAKTDLCKADVWALGVVLYSMITGGLPFCDDYTPRLYQNISSCAFNPISKQYSKELHSLINDILKKDPEERPDPKTILKCKWLQKVQ